MGRVVRPHRARSPLPVVEEAIAALHEELGFTLNYAEAMVREDNYGAAVWVIDEQRRSLVRTSDRIEAALSEPSTEQAPRRARGRLRAAVAGVAAAMLLASGAFAAWGPRHTQTPARRIAATIERAQDALARATESTDPVQVTDLVGSAQINMLQLAKSAPNDPNVKRQLLDLLNKQEKVLRKNPNLPANVLEQAKMVAETVQQIVVEVPLAPSPAPEAETSEAS